METHKPLMEIIVRNECAKDYRRVEEIARAAFFTPWRIEIGKIGCPYEHWMVNELRKRDGILALSLVAEIEGVVMHWQEVMACWTLRKEWQMSNADMVIILRRSGIKTWN